MSVFETRRTRRARLQAFTRAQLPLLAGTLFISVEGAFALPHVVGSPAAVSGAALIIISSVLFLSLPWEQWPVSALIPLALIDVTGVAFLRLAYFGDLPSVGILTIFPTVWLAYAFRRWTIALAVLGAFFITLLPFIVDGTLPNTALGIASIITLPAIVTGLAIAVGEAGRQLARSQRQARETNIELKRSLARAEDNQALTQILFETVDVAIAFYDTDKRLVMANTRAVQAVTAAGFQLDKEPYAGPEVRGADNTELIPFEDQIIPRALRGQLQDHQMEWIGPIGHQIAIVASSATVNRTDGTKWGTLIAAHDITDLARSLQVKDEFIATVSHELRTPLTSIVGYLEVLTDELEGADPFITESLEASARNAQKLQARIQELLATADQRQSLNIQDHDLATVISQVIEAQTQQAEAAHVQILSEVPTPLWARLDADRIEQVLDNLISNAIKYAPGGRVVVSARILNGSLLIAVADNGIGMSPDEATQAFDMFWRADGARRDAIQGIGIGLSLARRLVEAHQGTIHINSTHGKGTTFTITLPQANQ